MPIRNSRNYPDRPPPTLEGKPWSALRGQDDGQDVNRELGTAVVEASDCVGTFRIERREREPSVVDAYSNVIEDDEGIPAFRLVALVDVTAHEQAQREELEQRIREKDTLLREIQHRVKNNLQMITALIRLEARNAAIGTAAAPSTGWPGGSNPCSSCISRCRRVRKATRSTSASI